MALEAISKKEYLGRGIILGQTKDGRDVAVYFVTGRSPSSRARKLVAVGNKGFKISVTDNEQLRRGNTALLVYNACRIHKGHVAVSNGAQTDLIFQSARDIEKGASPSDILKDAFSRPRYMDGKSKDAQIDLTRYEPDFPNYTSRISGILSPTGLALHMACERNGGPATYLFSPMVSKGKGHLLTTYEGTNVPIGAPIPSFDPINRGGLQRVDLPGDSPREISDAVYEALGPKEGPDIVLQGADLRVAVAAVFYNRADDSVEMAIRNRCDE
ncbi:MAG: IMP cyclohydrolase [Candidatus Nanoarchaeia archaeon]